GAVKGVGNALDNVISGNALDNTLSGLGGNDTFDASAGYDFIDGGTGTNTADYSGLSTTGLVAIVQGAGGIVNKGAGNANDTLTSIQNVIGSAASDVFYADGGEKVTGMGGFDYLIELSPGVNLSYGTNISGITEFVSNTGNN